MIYNIYNNAIKMQKMAWCNEFDSYQNVFYVKSSVYC